MIGSRSARIDYDGRIPRCIHLTAAGREEHAQRHAEGPGDPEGGASCLSARWTHATHAGLRDGQTNAAPFDVIVSFSAALP